MLRSILSQLSSMAMALIIAVIVWSYVTSEQNPTRESLYPYALPVAMINIPEGMIVYKQSPTTVRIQVRAPQATWDQLSSSSFRAVADLKGLSADMHQVPVKVEVIDPGVVVTNVDPPTVGVQLEPLKSRSFEVRSDVLDTAPLGFVAKSPVTTPPQVTVSGPRVLVDQVSEVIADVFLRGAKSPIEREIAPVATDAQGNVVDGVTITPATVKVQVQIDQQVGYKDISVKAVLKGAPARGYWVSNIVVTPSTATIVGSADALARVQGLVETSPIDIASATADITRTAALVLPPGVSVLSNQGFTVQVSVTPIVGGQTFPGKVTVIGQTSTQIVTISPASVDVILSGPLPALESLGPNNVQVSVDVSGLDSGTYQVKPQVLGLPDTLHIQNIAPDTVQVTITEPTPTPTAAPRRTPIRPAATVPIPGSPAAPRPTVTATIPDSPRISTQTPNP